MLDKTYLVTLSQPDKILNFAKPTLPAASFFKNDLSICTPQPLVYNVTVVDLDLDPRILSLIYSDIYIAFKSLVFLIEIKSFAEFIVYRSPSCFFVF